MRGHSQVFPVRPCGWVGRPSALRDRCEQAAFERLEFPGTRVPRVPGYHGSGGGGTRVPGLRSTVTP
eukprot:455059-Rhodomonas_salina.8